MPVLTSLFEEGRALKPPLEVVGVVTQPDRRAGRGQRASVNPVTALAGAFGVPVQQPGRLRAPDAVGDVAALGPELIVVASYGQIIPQAILDLPAYRCLNLHPSLLPLYRGPSPIVGPLLAGDPMTGVSLMLMTAAMDAGPVVAQERSAIGTTESAGELESRLAHSAASLLMEHVPAWIAGKLVPQPQDDSRATYTAKLSKNDGRVDWTLPAEEITRRVRAFNPWPGAFTFWSDRQVRLLRARVAPGSAVPGTVATNSGRELLIGTGDGLLIVDELQLAGRKPLDARAFLHGYPQVEGARFGGEPAWSLE